MSLAHWPARRCLETEWLDTLAPDDPRALRSRRDLARLNRVMGSAGILRRRLQGRLPAQAVIAELGAGDGSLMLALVRQLPEPPARVLLVDQHPGIAAGSCAALAALGCEAQCIAADALDWILSAQPADAILCNLFLHHLPPQPLAALLQACAAKTSLFVACEPARRQSALVGSHLVGLIGCNAVSRHDAVVSVRAGFRGQELSALWPQHGVWELAEQAAGPFSHVFSASLR